MDCFYYFSLVVFVRSDNFDFSGRCIISMKSAEDAQRVFEYGNRRVIGGNVVKMTHVGFPSFFSLELYILMEIRMRIWMIQRLKNEDARKET